MIYRAIVAVVVLAIFLTLGNSIITAHNNAHLISQNQARSEQILRLQEQLQDDNAKLQYLVQQILGLAQANRTALASAEGEIVNLYGQATALQTQLKKLGVRPVVTVVNPNAPSPTTSTTTRTHQPTTTTTTVPSTTTTTRCLGVDHAIHLC